MVRPVSVERRIYTGRADNYHSGYNKIKDRESIARQQRHDARRRSRREHPS